ncbi:aldehyde dehydrogenase family protein [Acinetobacter baumannii]
MANDTERFGLAAYLFTQSTARQWRVGEALEYGMVGTNTGAISSRSCSVWWRKTIQV